VIPARIACPHCSPLRAGIDSATAIVPPPSVISAVIFELRSFALISGAVAFSKRGGGFRAEPIRVVLRLCSRAAVLIATAARD
jgi:hypothetical protein